MKIVFVTDLFQPEMGYATVRLPAAMAKVDGVEVHVVTSGFISPLQHLPKSERDKRIGESIERSGKTVKFEGVNVHYLATKFSRFSGMKIIGLENKLRELNPDVVQAFVHFGWSAIDTALIKRKLNYKLFTGNHTGVIAFGANRVKESPYSLANILNFVKKKLPGRFVSKKSEICYCASEDANFVATKFFGVSKSIAKTQSLGVDIDLFHPPETSFEREAALSIRRSHNVSDSEILCVYTGKLLAEKAVVLLAEAISELRVSGFPYRAVFYGEGPELQKIKAIEGAITHPFVPYKELGHVYRAADIAVWPAEITTSTLDGAACGIPIIVNDQILANERYEGNGLTYRLGDKDDLKRALLELKDPALRKKLGDEGARKMREEFSWDALVAERLTDYRKALGWGD